MIEGSVEHLRERGLSDREKQGSHVIEDEDGHSESVVGDSEDNEKSRVEDERGSGGKDKVDDAPVPSLR